MNPQQTQNSLRRFKASIRRAWLIAVRSVDRDGNLAPQAAERFADVVIRLSIQAGYAEARHLRMGIFDPTVDADRFRIERGGVVARFLSDVRNSAPGVSVGLSARQRQDLRAFAVTLQQASLDAIDFSEVPTFNNAESLRQVKRVERAMIETRASLIGRTEATAALSFGVDAAIAQTEQFREDPVKRTWLTASDEKVRSSHSALSGQVKAIGDPFISGNGNALMRPGDPDAPVSERANCRCLLVTES